MRYLQVNYPAWIYTSNTPVRALSKNGGLRVYHSLGIPATLLIHQTLAQKELQGLSRVATEILSECGAKGA